MAEFPGSIPTNRQSATTEYLSNMASGFGHVGLHNFHNNEVIALATKLGTGATTPASGLVLRGTGSGVSAWGQLVLSTDLTTFSSADLAGLVTDETGTGALVFGSTPTLITPTIASFANATHDHTNSAGGGQLGTAALSNASVTASKLATGAANASVATSETTTSTSYADLATTTDSVTVTIGANGLAIVMLQSFMSNDTNAAKCFVGVDISGATTTAAADGTAIEYQSPTTTQEGQYSGAILLTGLNAGSTTFKMKYKVATGGAGAGTGTFKNRRIGVVPL